MNTIRCVKSENGEISFDERVIKNHFVDFFKNLFNSSFEGKAEQNMFISGLKVNDSNCVALVRDVSYNEVTQIIKELLRCKAVGPDGFNAEFLKAAWPVCGADVVQSIRSFFWTGSLPSSLNSTYLALILKVCGACELRDFRPISCCNIIYKVISSILAKRLKTVLPYLVEISQSVFIKGRNIADNVCLVQQLLSNYNRKNVSKRCMLKLDLSKAYDTVDWKFLEASLTLFGFPSRFVKWIMSCICSVKCSVLINGNLEGFFGSNRGLRQGDPISPYLFTLVMEVLGRILGKMKLSKEYNYHPKCARIGLSRLMFADELIIFSKASQASLEKIKEALQSFYDCSGLKVNLDKSEIFFGGCSEAEKIALSSSIRLRAGRLPFRYLGVPLNSKSPKIDTYKVLLYRVTAKISC
ncbi:hypothetical protein QQ045_020430 [Rhodiola kirilowii]